MNERGKLVLLGCVLGTAAGSGLGGVGMLTGALVGAGAGWALAGRISPPGDPAAGPTGHE
ncbi:MAG: hypothetical protein ABEI11_00165 [Haloarculaceae archaeon]